VQAVSGHDLTRTYDCARPGCEGEAEVEGGLCPHCTRMARERAQEGSEQAGKLETATLALIGLARELDAELAAWQTDVEEAREQLAGRLN
jgi:hypothetical protein